MGGPTAAFAVRPASCPVSGSPHLEMPHGRPALQGGAGIWRATSPGMSACRHRRFYFPKLVFEIKINQSFCRNHAKTRRPLRIEAQATYKQQRATDLRTHLAPRSSARSLAGVSTAVGSFVSLAGVGIWAICSTVV